MSIAIAHVKIKNYMNKTKKKYIAEYWYHSIIFMNEILLLVNNILCIFMI